MVTYEYWYIKSRSQGTRFKSQRKTVTNNEFAIWFKEHRHSWRLCRLIANVDGFNYRWTKFSGWEKMFNLPFDGPF